ncbi:MAG: Hsp20/alpha crystallin family protein [Pseudomonadota bacterium]
MSRDPKDRKGGGDPMGEIRTGFEGLFGTLGEVISEIADRLETGEAREVRKSFEWNTEKGPVRAEAGVRMRFADAGGTSRPTRSRPMAEPVNPERPAAKAQPKATEAPRPIDFEILDDGSTWRLSADLPGVAEAELSLTGDDGELVIETTGKRRYHAVCPLPPGVTADQLAVTLRNGILELHAKLGDKT